MDLKRAFLILSLIIFLDSCNKSTPPKSFQVPVTAMKVVSQTIPAEFTYVGVVESSHIVELRARVEGYLEKISYVEGTPVKVGDPMFTLDQRPFLDSLHEAEGNLARQKALLWNAEQTKNRMVPLYEQNAVSQKDYDDAIAQELAAKANVLIARAAVEKAQVELSYTSIEAPVNGIASRAIYREGALISPGPSSSLLTNIYVIDPIWVNFSVSEGDVLKARREQCLDLLQFPKNDDFDIEVILADGTVMPAYGKINFLDPAFQQDTGTMLVRSTLNNPNAWLRPGQFVQVNVKGAIRPNAIIVPQSAVLMGQNGTFVYLVSKEGKAEVRPVETGDWYQDYWIINSGLHDGDIVIGKGVNRVQNQTPVVVQAWMPSAPPPVATKKQKCIRP